MNTGVGGLPAPPVRHAILDDSFRAYDGPKFVPTFEIVLLYMTVAVGAGQVTRWLDRLWRERTSTETLSRVASHLHDGVLQTLAVVQRRSDDPSLVRMARTSEVDVRRLLFGDSDRAIGGLMDVIVEAASEAAERFHLAVEYAIVDDAVVLDEGERLALGTAVREAVVNVGKHARAERVVIFADRAEGGLVVTVKDDGTGFDTNGNGGGSGITASIRAPMRAIGGDATVLSRLGEGSQVRLSLPLTPRSGGDAAARSQ